MRTFLIVLAGAIIGVMLARLASGQDAYAFASPQHPALSRLAQQHAEYQARVCVQGHQGFSQQFHAAQQAVGLSQVSEICAECWPWQHNATWTEQWAEYTKCWRQSPGHWSVARQRHRLIGVGSARGANGVWYGVLIAAD